MRILFSFLSPSPSRAAGGGGGGMMSGLGGMVAQGMAFGTGSAIAHRAVGAVAGAMSGDDGAERSQEYQSGGAAPQQEQQQNPCMENMQAFNLCVQQNGSDISMCQGLYEALQSCQLSVQQQQQYS